jgi:hypothetical protein
MQNARIAGCGSRCRKCGLPIAFKMLESGKLCPTNPDGGDHWDLCRETVNAGRTFDPARDTKTSGFIVGENYLLQGGVDGMPLRKL